MCIRDRISAYSAAAVMPTFSMMLVSSCAYPSIFVLQKYNIANRCFLPVNNSRVIFRAGGLTFFQSCTTILISEGDAALTHCLLANPAVGAVARSIATTGNRGRCIFYFLHYTKYPPTKQGDNQLFAIFSFRIAPKRQGTPSSVPFLMFAD